jgi:L-lactate dehydrogenase (cytochrome)
MIPVTFDDYREAARGRLPRILFDYIDGGAYGEETLRRNVDDLRHLSLRQRILRDVSQVNLRCRLFGEDLSMPVALGPVGLAGMYARRGEVQAARAAENAGISFCLSSVAVCSVREVAAQARRPIWFQLYMMRDRGFMAQLLSTARDHGCSVLLLTVDLPVPGVRYREVRSGMVGPASLSHRITTAFNGASHPGWLWDVFVLGRPHALGNIIAGAPNAKTLAEFWDWVRLNLDPAVTWTDLTWLRDRWPGPIVLKGVLDVEDAREAVRAGMDGIVVSNHGGRQLDSARSSISALPEIVAAIDNRLSVLVDGGIRSGIDVVKTLALGANACLLGRAWAYPLAAGGQRYVTHMLETLRQEIGTALRLTGCLDVKDAGQHMLAETRHLSG